MIRNTVRNAVNSSVRGVQRGFDPFSLSPLAWYDTMNDGTVITSGSNVTAWNDSSGNGYDLVQATGANQPTFANDTISFNGTTGYLWRAESFMYSASNTVTLFVVMESSAGTSSRMITEASTSSGAPLYLLLETPSGDATQMKTTIRNDASSITTSAASITGAFGSGITKVYMIEDDGSNITSLINGDSLYSASYTRPATPITLNSFAVGARVTTSVDTFADIDVKEIIIFHAALTDDQKSQMNDYLMNKHGITA